jgi:hypothetical protein
MLDQGYAFSFGVFQDYYSVHEPFKESKNIAVIGTCAMVLFSLPVKALFGGINNSNRGSHTYLPLSRL